MNKTEELYKYQTEWADADYQAYLFKELKHTVFSELYIALQKENPNMKVKDLETTVYASKKYREFIETGIAYRHKANKLKAEIVRIENEREDQKRLDINSAIASRIENGKGGY